MSKQPTPHDALALLDECAATMTGSGNAQRRHQLAQKVRGFLDDVAQHRYPEDYSDDPEWRMDDVYADGDPIWTDGENTAWVGDLDGRKHIVVGDTKGEDGRPVPIGALWAILRSEEGI